MNFVFVTVISQTGCKGTTFFFTSKFFCNFFNKIFKVFSDIFNNLLIFKYLHYKQFFTLFSQILSLNLSFSIIGTITLLLYMENKKTQLPENAHRELKPGEEYQPLLSPQKNYPEVTPWSVTLGLIMTVIFSAAAAYLGLKVGQVFEAAIPIAIIAVGLSSALGRKNALGENVMVQSIGSCSGAIVAGAIFTLPALFILQDKYPELTVNFTKVFLSENTS